MSLDCYCGQDEWDKYWEPDEDFSVFTMPPNRKNGYRCVSCKKPMTFFIDGDGCDKIHAIEFADVTKTYVYDD